MTDYRKELLGYCEPWSLRAGETLEVKVSSERGRAFELSLHRVISGDDSAEGPGFQAPLVAHPAAGRYPGRRQPIPCGSHARVEDHPVLAFDGDFSLECLVWPTLPQAGAPQTLAGRTAPDGRGWRLLLDEAGRPALERGGARLVLPRPLPRQTWWRLAAGIDAEGHAQLLAEPLGPGFRRQQSVAGRLAPAAPAAPGTAFVIAASLDGEGRPVAGFNGKLEAVTLRRGGSLLAAWDFAQDIMDETVADRGPHGLAGRTVNAPTRAVPGQRWDGSVHDWRQDPSHYAAIHFHDDDLDDAGWESCASLTLPADLPSGAYAVRVATADDETWLPFFLRPAAGAPRRPLAVLASTASFMAYGNLRLPVESALYEVSEGNGTPVIGRLEATLAERWDLGTSHYDLHRDGSPTMIVSRRRPVLNFTLKSGPWAFNADTHLLAWLAAIGQDYDVVSDCDLDREGPAALEGYRCLVTGAHPEYWSTRMWDALVAFQNGGGRFVYLGGNGFYWRVAYHPEKPWLLECRRAESGARYGEAPPGTYWHAFTGEYGGLWRRIGRSPQSLVGVGMVGDGWDRSEAYRRRPDSRDPRAAFIFAGIGADERIGAFGLFGGGAAGAELDVADYALGTPAHALIVASSETHSRAYWIAPEETLFLHAGTSGDVNRRVRADLVFYETPNGGAVFSTGSIAWCAALPADGFDNNVARLTGNVLRRFLDPAPFKAPE